MSWYTMTTRKNGQRRPVKTVETTVQLLDHLKESDGATLNELADEFDIARSTIHRHLTTLNSLELVIKQEGAYYPSLRFLEFGQYARTRNPGYEMAKSKIEELANRTEERAQFLVEEHGKGVYVYRSIGSKAVLKDPGIGKRIYLNTMAAGKAILAQYPRERVEEIIDRHGLPAATENTITDEDVFFDELADVRERGFSFNKQESVKGLRAVGVPVTGPGGDVLGALSVSGPTHRMQGSWFEEELPNLMLGMANEIELSLTRR